jgi:hypothetical protein
MDTAWLFCGFATLMTRGGLLCAEKSVAEAVPTACECGNKAFISCPTPHAAQPGPTGQIMYVKLFLKLRNGQEMIRNLKSNLEHWLNCNSDNSIWY